ncbi:MAG: hypothetical protein KAU48_08040, partial [Candidatus Thorarchaeota archaeon]|nr:hypothetical protein [Candidatus Thorarchaeota archaeon]
ITIDPANGSTVEAFQYITINVIETGSGFASSELFIDGVSVANNTAPSVGIAWDTTVISDGEYNITVVASDIAGNNAVVTHLMTVNNSVTTTTTTGTEVPQDFTGAILIIVVIVIIGAVAVIYIFVLKKK